MARAARKVNVKHELSESLDFVTREREIIVFRAGKGRKPIAVLVPVNDEAQVEALEDELDVREARKARKERGIPWEQVKKELGL